MQAAASEVTNENGATMLTCSVADEQQAQAKIGMTVRAAGEEGTVTEIIDDNQEAFLMIELNRPGAAETDNQNGTVTVTGISGLPAPVKGLFPNFSGDDNYIKISAMDFSLAGDKYLGRSYESTCFYIGN